MAAHRMVRPRGTWLLATGFVLALPLCVGAQVPPPSADLSLAMIGGGYQIPVPLISLIPRVTNIGPDTAVQVVIEIPSPPGTVFSSVSPPDRASCAAPEPGSTGTVRCVRATLAPGETYGPHNINFIVQPGFVDSIFPVSASTGSDTPDPDTSNNQFSIEVIAFSLEARDDRAISVTTDSTFAQPGDTLIFDVTVTSNGPQPSNFVEWTVFHPFYVLPVIQAPPEWTCVIGGAGPSVPPPLIPATCRADIVRNGTYQFRVLMPVPGGGLGQPFESDFNVQGSPIDPNPANDNVDFAIPIGIGGAESVAVDGRTWLLVLALSLLAIGAWRTRP